MQLNRENRGMVLKISTYLRSHYLNEYAYRTLREDILGMALESQSRGERFADTIGASCAVFCEELVKNTVRQTLIEKILGILIAFFAYIAIIIPAMYLFSMCIHVPGVSTSGVMLHTPFDLVVKYLLIVAAVDLGWILLQRNIYVSSPVVLGALFCFLTLAIIGTDYAMMWIQDSIVEVNVLLWIVALAAIILALLGVKAAIARRNSAPRKDG